MTNKFKPNSVPIVLITGPAGAGRSTSIHALEDLNFEAIDNLPLRLIPKLLDGAEMMVDDYVGRGDWMVRENSNMDYSLQGLNNYISSGIASR